MSQYKIGLGINYYDDPYGLIRILTDDTVYDFIDVFYVIDGRYDSREDMPEYDPFFPDDLKKLYRKIHLVKMFGTKQIDKRNKYWELAEHDNLDFMIVCDSDEYIKINPDTFTISLRNVLERDSKCFPILQHNEDLYSQARPRLFKAPFTFRHKEITGNNISHGSLWEDYGKGNHDVIHDMYLWYKDHEKTNELGYHNAVSGIEMFHNKEYRSRDRVIADRIYYDNVKNR